MPLDFLQPWENESQKKAMVLRVFIGLQLVGETVFPAMRVS